MPEFNHSRREADMRELHHFETEQENERLTAEYHRLYRELASPPPGWFTFGSHVGQTVRLEFWGDDGGMPIWERPAEEADRMPGREMMLVVGDDEGRRWWRRGATDVWHLLPHRSPSS